MAIAVTTPTGNVGSLLVTQLLQAGERPTLLVRDATKLESDVRDACDVRECDQGDAEAVAQATRGVEALYWVDPPPEDDDPVEGYARMGASAAHAIRANGIPRVVFQSSVGAEARGGFGDIDGLARTEELLDETDAAITHLRCGYFFSNLLMDLDDLREGRLETTLPLDLAIPWVAPGDIATVAAGRLLSTAWSGRHTLGVHGPVDLTFAEVASIVGEAVGRDIRVRRLSDDEAAAPLREAGLTEAQIEGIIGMARGLRGDFTPENQRDVITTTPTTLGSWAFEHLRPEL